MVQPGVDALGIPTDIEHPNGWPRLGGNDSGSGDSDTVGSSEGRGTRSLPIVPYLDVLPEYRERASRTIERPGFPVELRDLVRDYFDRIGNAS